MQAVGDNVLRQTSWRLQIKHVRNLPHRWKSMKHINTFLAVLYINDNEQALAKLKLYSCAQEEGESLEDFIDDMLKLVKVGFPVN